MDRFLALRARGFPPYRNAIRAHTLLLCLRRRGRPGTDGADRFPTEGHSGHPAEQWLVLVKCRDEKQRVALLERFQREGLECKALVS